MSIDPSSIPALLLIGAIAIPALVYGYLGVGETILDRAGIRTLGPGRAAIWLFLPLALPEARALDWRAVPAAIWGWTLFYALSASVLSFLLWYRGISRVPASTAGLFTGLMPVGSALVGVSLLGERFGAGHALGMALVLTALLLATRPAALPPVAAERTD